MLIVRLLIAAGRGNWGFLFHLDHLPDPCDKQEFIWLLILPLQQQALTDVLYYWGHTIMLKFCAK